VIEERALKGVPWTFLSFFLSKLIVTVTTLALARLLDPSDFGLVALGLLAVGVLMLLRDLGLGGALVIRQDLEERQIGTVLTLIVIMSALTAGVVAASTPLVAAAMDEPRLETYLPALSLIVFFGGLSVFYDAFLQRRLEFRRRFVASVAGSSAYAVVSIPLALGGVGAWSLVAGLIASVVAQSIGLLLLTPERVRPAFDPKAARDVLGTSRGFLFQGGLAFIHQNVDYFVVGRILGATPLGYYSLAYRLGELPYMGIADAVAKVTFPGFARMRHRGEDPGPAFLSTLRLVSLLTVPIGMLMSAAAEPLVATILGSEWKPMVPLLQILGLWAAVRAVQATIAWLLNSIGQAGLTAALSAVALVVLVPSLVVGAHVGGARAVAAVMLADMTLSLLALSVVVARRAGVPLRQQWNALRAITLAAPAAWLAAYGASQLPAPAPAALFAAVAAGLAAFGVTLALIEPRLLPTAWRQMARFATSRPTEVPSLGGELRQPDLP
jgi:PST family polysaccharide transporter